MECVIEREHPFLEAHRQSLALKQFHDEIGGPGLFADVIQRANVRDRASLAIKTTAELRVRSKMWWQNFDGDDPIEARISCAIDFAHPARAEGSEDLVRAEACARRQGQGDALDYTSGGDSAD